MPLEVTRFLAKFEGLLGFTQNIFCQIFVTVNEFNNPLGHTDTEQTKIIQYLR